MSIYTDFIDQETQTTPPQPQTKSIYTDFIDTEVQEEEKKKKGFLARTGENLLKGIISAPKAVIEGVGAGVKAIGEGKPILPENPDEYMQAVNKSMVESGKGMAEWTYKTPINLVKDPIGQISQDPLGTAAWLVTAGGGIGAGIKGIKRITSKGKPVVEPMAEPTKSAAELHAEEKLARIKAPGYKPPKGFTPEETINLDAARKAVESEWLKKTEKPISEITLGDYPEGLRDFVKSAWEKENFSTGQERMFEDGSKLPPTEWPIPPTEATKPIVTGTEQPPTTLPVLDAAQKVQVALKKFPAILKEKALLSYAEKSQRLRAAKKVGQEIPGEAGYYAQLKELEGKLTTPEWDAVIDGVSLIDRDALHQRIRTSEKFKGFESIAAERGLKKVLDGELIQPKELELLNREFGAETVRGMTDHRGFFRLLKDYGIELGNASRAIMSSGDLSFGLRQGVVTAARHPKIFAKSFGKQFKWFASEKEALLAEAKQKASGPIYELAKDSGVAMTERAGPPRMREEKFESPSAEKIPIIGRMVKASNRGYTVMANQLRLDTFEYLVKRAQDLGLDPYSNGKLARDIAKVVNRDTGRGSLGKLENAAVALNATLFSPRLIASRLQMLNPAFYVKLHPFARVQALKSLLSYAGAVTTVAGLAKLMGTNVGTDIRSADFGKIKIGNTRIDISGGMLPYIRLAGQLITGELVSSTTGKVSTLGEGYKPLTRLDILQRGLESKVSPVTSFAIGLLRGKGTVGKEFKLLPDVSSFENFQFGEIASRFIPMVAQDLVDIAKDDPGLIPVSALGVFGVGLQTYDLNNPHNAIGQELDRMKLSLPNLSRLGGKDKVPGDVYKTKSQEAESEIYSKLNAMFSNPSWSTLSDEDKIKIIQHDVRTIKRRILKVKSNE